MPSGDNQTIMETEVYASKRAPLCLRVRSCICPLKCYEMKRGKVEIKLTTDFVSFRINPSEGACYDTACCGENLDYNDYTFCSSDYSGVLLNVTKGCACTKNKGTVRICFGPPPTPELSNVALNTVIKTKETGVAKNAYLELELHNNADIARVLNVVSLLSDMKADASKGMRQGIADGVFPSDVVINREGSVGIKGATSVEKDFLPIGADETVCTGFRPSRGLVTLITDRQIIVIYHPCCSRTRQIFSYPLQKVSYTSMIKIPVWSTLCGRAIFCLNFQKLQLNFTGKKGAMMKFYQESMKYLIANTPIEVPGHSDDPVRCVLPRVSDEVTHYTFAGMARFLCRPVKANCIYKAWSMEVSNYFVRITMGANEYCIPVKNVTGWHVGRQMFRKGKFQCKCGGKEKGQIQLDMIAKGMETIPQIDSFTVTGQKDADRALEFIGAWFDAKQ